MKRSSTYTLLRAFVLAAFLVLIGRLWYMQIVEVKAYRATATADKTRSRTVPAPRGIIYDSSGRPLVRNLPRIDVTVTPGQWSANHGVRESRLLSRLLHHHPGAGHIRWLVWHSENAYPYITTTPETVRAGIGYRTFLIIRSYANLLPGVDAGSTLSHRFYLDAAPYALSHILGYAPAISTPEFTQYEGAPAGTGPFAWEHYTLTDLSGKSGLELYFEHELHGVNGLQTTQFNNVGDQVTPWKTVRPAIAGDGVRLTINSKFQNQVAQDIQDAMTQNSWPLGAAVVMNPNNGHVLAMVGLPSYNSNLFTAATLNKRQSRELNNVLKPQKYPPQYDSATEGTYPPGSIYKIVTATAGLATGVITPNTVVDDTGSLQKYPGGHVYNGWQPAPGLGDMNVVSAIAESSDIYFYEVAGGGPAGGTGIPGNGLGPYRLGRWARRYGLGQNTGIELQDSTGLVPSPKELSLTQHRPWSYGDSYNMGIGQGDNLVTVIQMARVASAIANGGNLVRPTLLQGITGPNGHRILHGFNYGAVPDVVRPHFVPRWITGLIGQGMRDGLMHNSFGLGTSAGQVDPRTEAAGKTGTAQDPNGVDAWWIGFAPYNHPKIAVAVCFPHSNTEGAWGAAPVASKIILDYEHKSAPNWLSKVRTQLDNFG